MFSWRILLFPFAFLYGCIVYLRNFLFDISIFKSYRIPSKSIVVGNLSVGGTGKSPHILYILSLLNHQHPTAIISRGYGRKTKGLLEVQENSTASDVGDEPLMFKKQLKSSTQVVVSEKRKIGVDFVLEKNRNAVILLDDAFQHRYVKAGFSVILTDFNNPYYNSFMLPMGDLREFTSGKNRADCVVVTKCPDGLTEDQKKIIKSKLKWKNEQVFFSKMNYGNLIPFGEKVDQIKNVLLVTGIANPKPLLEMLSANYTIELMSFPDHHNFTKSDIDKILRKFDIFASAEKAIITTEKDYVRLESLLRELNCLHFPWYYQAMTVKIDEEEKFKTLINKYVDTI